MPNALADIANAQLAQRRAQMTHEPYTPYQPAVEARQGIGRWAQGVGERSSLGGLLGALASEAQRYQQMPPEEIAGSIGPSGGSGLVGMFAGRGAKTANLAELARAEEMAKAGVPDPEIWKQTGWTLNTPDKIPRFEIPDVEARFLTDPLQRGWGKAAKEFEHELLYGAYPQAKKIDVIRSSSSGGRYSPPPATPYGEISVGLSGKQDAESMMIHELQHAIQQREGFARGGNIEEMKGAVLPSQQRMLDELSSIGEPIDKKGMPLAFKPANQLTPEEKAIKDRYTYLVQQTQLNANDPYQAYRNLAGEAEARLTQARMAMTPEQRLAQYPYEPEYFQQATGVPLRDLIVRQEGGAAMSIPQSNNIPQLISDMAEARRVYEAQRAARLAQPQQNTLANLATGAGAFGAGTGLGYYGTEYLLGDRQ